MTRDERTREDRRLMRQAFVGGLATLVAVALVFVFIDAADFEDGPTAPLPDGRKPNAEIRAEVDANAREKAMTYRWVDREKGVVRVPIDRAVELTLRDASTEAGNR